MIPSLRRQFNAAFSPARYAAVLAWLADRLGGPTRFRHSETPCFLPAALVDRMARSGREMVEQLLANPAYAEASRAAIPAAWRAPREAPVPLFVQADFGLDAALQPKLVEIQGFPSLYAYQPLLAAAYRAAYSIDPALSQYPGGLNDTEYSALLRQAIVGSEDPENVVLLELDPSRQKTFHDFVMTERMFGVRAVDIRAIVKQGSRLFYDRDGTLTPIRRVYNRVIADELERRHVSIPFDFRDDLDLEWAGHPNWFFRLSKFSLPWLRHPDAPATVFLDQAGDIGDPARYVLKPLYSFAGAGVVVGPSREEIDAVPPAQRANYVLQERIDFRPVIETPHGPTRVEVRIMYLWLDRLRPVNTIIRMGRGAQMGVDFNKDFEWVGASAAFIAPGDRS